MKKILIIIMMFITFTTLYSLNNQQVGKVEGNDGKYIKLYVNEKSNIYLETDTRMTFHLSNTSLVRYIKLLNIQMELVEVGKTSELRYRRDSGQLWASVPSNVFVQFEYYCSGQGGEDSSTITIIITDLNGTERIEFKPDQIKKLSNLIKESLDKKKVIKAQIDKFNNIIDKTRQY